ncbi:MAG: hypothetical protein IKC79_02930 [Clostridia bacterium]|nr:hypothetical protein [Clostridia bacterium]
MSTKTSTTTKSSRACSGKCGCGRAQKADSTTATRAKAKSTRASTKATSTRSATKSAKTTKSYS